MAGDRQLGQFAPATGPEVECVDLGMVPPGRSPPAEISDPLATAAAVPPPASGTGGKRLHRPASTSYSSTRSRLVSSPTVRPATA